MTRVVVIGDATLDVIARPAASLRAGGDQPGEIGVAPGGQGANVAVRLARQGIEVRLVTRIGDDAAGRLLAALLTNEGVAVGTVPGRTSTVVSIAADGERTMISDRVSLDPDALVADLGESGWVHCSAYPLADAAGGDALAAALGRRQEGVRVSVGGAGGWSDAGPGALVARLRSCRPDLLILARDEAAYLTGQHAPDARAAVTQLATVVAVPVAIVTDGERGSAAAGSDLEMPVVVPAPPIATPATDPTGAGDAFAAAVIAAVAVSRWPPSSATLEGAMVAGSRLGALVARVIGAQTRAPGEPEAKVRR